MATLRETVRQQTEEMAARTRAAWRQDVREFLDTWTASIDDPRRGMSPTLAYRSWTHWDDHRRQVARGRDRGCLPASVPERAEIMAAIPTQKEFSQILAELGVPKVRMSSGYRCGIIPVNAYCAGYSGFPCLAPPPAR